MKKIEIDPIDLAVLSNKIDGIIREMTNTLLFTARSGVINSARDFSCSICTGDGDLFAVAEGLPIHIFGSGIQAKSIKDFHKNVKEGDCYLDNDPYIGNTHAADHTFLVPVFFEGKHLFTAIAKAHQADIGNSLPTTYMAKAKDIYEEGALIFSMVKIQENYQMNDDIVRMMRKRIRVPSQWYGDFLAGISSVRIAEKRLKEMCEKYGVKVIKQFIEDWLNYSEIRMIKELKKLPSKELSNKSNHDPTPFLPDGIPLKVKIKINNKKSFINIDLRENIDCVDCGYNQSEATATSSVIAGVFNCLDPDIPKNAGSFRRIKVELRKGCITGIPKFPVCCSVATTNVSDRMINLTGATISKLGFGYGLSEAAVGLGVGMSVVSGNDPRNNNEPFINQLHLSANGGPASAKADGWVTFGLPVCAGLMYRDSVEVDELKHPFLIKKLSLNIDTGGAGKFRGGLSLEIEIVSKSKDFILIYPGDGQFFPPKGVLGGKDGIKAKRILKKKGEKSIELGNAEKIILGIDDVILGIDSSGGGYGNPKERNLNDVLEDVESDFVSLENAKKIYGVLIEKKDGINYTINREETKRLRSY
tara:strand:+ start:29 stop:1792 length:1764 start_codon:yes stop_codon:yes gene_type:complete